jgi:Xaa-Pro aminopeptidase
MKKTRITLALIFALFLFAAHAQDARAQQPQSPAPTEAATASTARVAEIQRALREANLRGWLFYDFRLSDPLAYRILKLNQQGITTRRWFYYVPAQGEPVRIVHSIERGKLDQLPGQKRIYRSWQDLRRELSLALRPTRVPRSRVRNEARAVAMQYSPNNDIPYVSRVDAGTIELVRAVPVEIVTSADLVQRFEAVWTPEQRDTHIEASNKIHRIIIESFDEIARRIRANEPTTEYDIQQFMLRRFEEEGLTSDNEAPIVAVNANSANPHYEPTRERHSPIRRGDFVLFDVWAKLKRPGAVYTDQSWTGYVGESVPEEHARIFRIVREARDAAIDFARAATRDGKVITGAQIDDVSRGIISRAGYAEQFLHRTGHSIGTEVHGNGVNIDNLETKDSRRLIPGVAFSIEPGIYLEGRFGVRSEVDVYVGQSDIEVTGQPVQTEVIAILKNK